LTDAEAAAAYDCLYPEIKASYANTGIPATRDWRDWATQFSTGAYVSATHGGRYVNNYSNTAGAEAYGKYEDLETMPVNSVLIKDSFSVNGDGSLSIGPLFIMEKMGSGFNPDTGDWRYYMLTPDGNLFGITKGTNSAGMAFCNDCHIGAEDTDYMMFLPDEYRVSSN